MFRLAGISGPGEGLACVISAEVMSLGRIPGNHLVVPDPLVSRRHCELWVADGALYVKDLGTANGTFVNDQRVLERALIAGDRLAVGSTVFSVESGA